MTTLPLQENKAVSGKFIFHLDELLKKHNMSKYQLGKLTGIRIETINRYCTGKQVKRIDLDVLRQLLLVFDCKLSDIFEFVK